MFPFLHRKSVNTNRWLLHSLLQEQDINITLRLYILLSSIAKSKGKIIFKAILNSHHYFLEKQSQFAEKIAQRSQVYF